MEKNAHFCIMNTDLCNLDIIKYNSDMIKMETYF